MVRGVFDEADNFKISNKTLAMKFIVATIKHVK